ncbi:MAG: glycosyltransferase [Rhodoferax sp.]|nr:glycosyltransferase [Rhodoferax sp.]
MLAQPASAAKPSKLDANLARQFAWLLRKDLREAYTTQDNPEFEDWWLIKGRQEFPGWADAAPTAQLQALFEPAGTATLGSVPITVPKLVSTLLKFRPDAVKELSVDGKLDNEKFFAWAMVRGLSEHKLAQHAPRSLMAMLDQPIPLPAGQPLTPDDATPPAASLLMYLLWRLLDDKLQTARSLQTAAGRKAFMAWFFGVAPQLELGPLIAGRWRAWLQSPGAATAIGPQATQLAEALRSAAAALRAKRSPAADATQAQAGKPFGLNIYGFAYGELGIGEDLRMAVECCEAANIPFHVVNVDAGSARQADMHLRGKVSESSDLPPYNTNLFCLPAFDTVSRVFMQKGAAVFEGYRNIGWWPWELSVFPKAWRPYAFELVDEVWASSQFLFDMYKQATDKPVKLVPLAVSVERMKPYPRSHYGLPEGKFLFLYIFDFNSSVARKNPMAAVKAFKQAFVLTDDSVGLVFKTMNTKANNPEWLAFLKECQMDRRIHVITETFDRPAVLGLINTCDAYVSLHRAEGFGRTMAEALLLGKPVVATNYSGNVDFIDAESDFLVDYKIINAMDYSYQWVDGADKQVWADVDINNAALQLENAKKFSVSGDFKKVCKLHAEKMSPHYLGNILSEELKMQSRNK